MSADPGAAGTVLNSGNFAFLPLVVAPNTLRLVLNPDGTGGTAPEIVIVTAHAAFATAVTVTRGTETAFGAGPAVSHPVDTIWRETVTRASLLELMVPAGSVIATVAATADPGYAMIDGTTLVNGQTLFPATWLRIPGAWKAAPDIVLPDWRGCTLFMDDAGALFALGGSGGANTHLLVQAELPAVTLSIDPPPLTIDPPPTAVTGNTGVESVPHVHDELMTQQYSTIGGGLLVAQLSGTSGFDTGPESVPHTHPAGTLAVDIAPFNVDQAPFPSPPLGSGTAIDTRPKFGVVNFQLKTH